MATGSSASFSALSDGIKGLLANPVATAAGGAVLGSAVTVGAIAVGNKIRKRKKASSRKKKAPRRSRKTARRTSSRKKKTVYARTAGKGKDRSTKRIRMTKNGQPYVILASGKARFISKRSARTSRKRKGGRY